MVFNFYINGKPADDNKEELETIMKKLENHFADWNDFYTFFTKTAGIPPRNAEKIQQFFNDLREDFVQLVEQYNNKIRHFADIHRTEQSDTDFENEVVKHMKDMIANKSKDNNDEFRNIYIKKNKKKCQLDLV